MSDAQIEDVAQGGRTPDGVCPGEHGCPWCDGSTDDDPDYDALCRDHQAEHEGLSVEGLDHRDAEWAAERRDSLG